MSVHVNIHIHRHRNEERGGAKHKEEKLQDISEVHELEISVHGRKKAQCTQNLVLQGNKINQPLPNQPHLNK